MDHISIRITLITTSAIFRIRSNYKLNFKSNKIITVFHYPQDSIIAVLEPKKKKWFRPRTGLLALDCLVLKILQGLKLDIMISMIRISSFYRYLTLKTSLMLFQNLIKDIQKSSQVTSQTFLVLNKSLVSKDQHSNRPHIEQIYQRLVIRIKNFQTEKDLNFYQVGKTESREILKYRWERKKVEM